MKQITGLIAWMVLLVAGLPSMAQKSMTLQECVNYGLENSNQMKNSNLEQRISEIEVKSIIGIAFPQVNLNIGGNYNFEPQKSLIRADAFVPEEQKEIFKDSADNVVSFAQKYDGNVVLSASQLIFDGSYFIGLQAARTLKELSKKKNFQTKTEIAESISKAYYNALITQEQYELIMANFSRVDTLYRETKAMNEEGFVEKIDLDRVKVSKNNLLVEAERVKRLNELSKKVLKFQMGMNLKDELVLADKLSDMTVLQTGAASDNFNYESRIEYQQLKINQELMGLDLKNNVAQYLPKLYLSFQYGWNTATSDFSNYFDRDRWLSLGALGVNLTIPVFDGLNKAYKIQKNRVQLQQIENQMDVLSKSIDMEIERASIDLKSNLEMLKVRKENVELAKEVYRISKIKYQEGVGSNIEVITADNSLKEAQVNYLNTLQQALISEVSLKKATGTLINNN